jgi:hypothetical protein
MVERHTGDSEAIFCRGLYARKTTSIIPAAVITAKRGIANRAPRKPSDPTMEPSTAAALIATTLDLANRMEYKKPMLRADTTIPTTMMKGAIGD